MDSLRRNNIIKLWHTTIIRTRRQKKKLIKYTVFLVDNSNTQNIKPLGIDLSELIYDVPFHILTYFIDYVFFNHTQCGYLLSLYTRHLVSNILSKKCSVLRR